MASFTCLPAIVPFAHPNAITLELTGVGTNWTNSSVFDFSPGTWIFLTNTTRHSATSVTLTIYTTGPAGGGPSPTTIVVTESVTGTAQGTFVIDEGSFTISPASGGSGENEEITFTGSNNVWTQEDSLTLFAASGTTGCGISPATVTGDNSATAFLSNGLSGGLTITDISIVAFGTVPASTALFTVAAGGRLTTIGNILLIPGMAALQTLYPGYLEALIIYADQAIKSYLKRDININQYVEYYNGNGTPNIILNQYPVYPSNLSVWFDPQGYWGQAPNAFASGTLLTQGTNYAVVIDSGGARSNRGLIQYLSGGPITMAQFWLPNPPLFTGKLAATRPPCWPVGQGNLKVSYVAGFNPIPADLVYAAGMTIAYMARTMSQGGPLQSESFEAYSYSILQSITSGDVPELWTTAQILKAYRESSW